VGACQHGDVAKVKRWLQRHSLAEYELPHQLSPLVSAAARFGVFAMLEALRDDGMLENISLDTVRHAQHQQLDGSRLVISGAVIAC